MTVHVGRVVRRSVPMQPVSQDRPAGPPTATPAGRLVGRQVVEEAAHAQQLIEQARQQAAAILLEAEQERARLEHDAQREGLAQGTAMLAASWVKLRAADAAADRRNEERVIEVARVLAERLLGEALRTEPATITSLAREAMRQLRRARRIAIEAHPQDADALRASLAELQVDPDVVEVADAPERRRGDLRVVSDLGTLDAALAPQLDRLVEAIRRQLVGS